MKSIVLFATLCMITSPVMLVAQEKPSSAGDKKTAGTSDADFEKAYQQLLEKDPRVREKIENGQATKEDVIAWMKNQKSSGKEKEVAGSSDEELGRLKEKLDTMVKAGTLSKEQAAKLLATMQGSSNNQQDQPKDMAAYGDELKAAVQSGKMTKEQAIKAWNQAMAGTKNGKAAARPSKGKMGSKTGVRLGSFNFYAIVIGRLRSKDIELGEIELDVDYVISERAKVNQELIGNRIKLVGISVHFLTTCCRSNAGKQSKSGPVIMTLIKRCLVLDTSFRFWNELHHSNRKTLVFLPKTSEALMVS